MSVISFTLNPIEAHKHQAHACKMFANMSIYIYIYIYIHTYACKYGDIVGGTKNAAIRRVAAAAGGCNGEVNPVSPCFVDSCHMFSCFTTFVTCC